MRRRATWRPACRRRRGAWRLALESGKDEGAHPARLRALVWAPLEKHLAGAEVVLLSPDAELARLPWAALPGAKEGTRLAEERLLAVQPVPGLLAARKAATGAGSLLSVGAVDFGTKAWEPLPATTPEAEAVASMFAGDKESLSGKEATRAAVRRALSRARVAHLATHGYFAPLRMASALARPDGEAGSLFERQGVSGWHPGLLSGLVLAGGEVASALELADLDLSGMELAVLSACQTALGKEEAGEGVPGLQRAFSVAGCKSVVSSLWSVHDAATAVLMERFYHHLWKGRKSKAEALRLAQLDVLTHPEWVEKRVDKLGTRSRGAGMKAVKLPGGARRSPPAWWAAWQVSGDWR
ncbi:MAG: CHAT domain-containing protein [Gemmataceae bacterium]|nr:CHAT domain-containing protein [Gemmataceae bacterium]